MDKLMKTSVGHHALNEAYQSADPVPENCVIERPVSQYLEATENKLCALEQLSTRFSPRTLLFGRDGSYALLLDDVVDPDNGLAVCLSPEEKVVTQDEYL
jgi:hypothetical protein